MLYSEIKRETLEHINQSTMAGAKVAESYNNQADYLKRIPALINEALVNILTYAKRELVVFPLIGGEEIGGMMQFTLPDNFYALKSGSIIRVVDGKFQHTNDYRLQGKKSILIPKDSQGQYLVEYYRYPRLLPPDPGDNYNLEEDIEVIQTATYYAAANLVLLEDEFAYASLYNDYESRLSRISGGITAEVQPVHDAYAFNAGWC